MLADVGKQRAEIALAAILEIVEEGVEPLIRHATISAKFVFNAVVYEAVELINFYQTLTAVLGDMVESKSVISLKMATRPKP